MLDHVCLKICKGEKLVIVGMNGAGKTTLIKLLCKFYKPVSGRITVNGVDIWSIENSEYYKLIAAVFQDYHDFAFTMEENISVSDNTDRDKLIKILCGLGINDLADNLKNGLETYVSRSFSSDGVDFSGGEAQKLAIARAIYKDSPVLILDEPTASLDAKAESEIYSLFFKMSADKTTIFISHRLAASTVADRIAVLDSGKISELGSHSELIKKNGLYAEMYRKQSEPYVNG